jgi:hypothetical protein
MHGIEAGMRVLTAVLAAVTLVASTGTAAAQVSSARSGTGGQGQSATGVGVGGSASSAGVNSNTNTLTTGNNTNRSLNTNAQFLSGNNTGANTGSLEVYAGADPYQGIVLEGSVSLPELPGFLPPTNNFSQPYKPETFVNVPAFLPAEMTLAEAKTCRDSKVSWSGRSREEAQSIRLFYAAKQETPAVPLTMTNYVGTAMARTSDGPFIAALCVAAYTAMSKGASVGVVDFSIRPKNTMFGIGFGASGGATGLPAAGAHPYAIAGALGFGTGWSNQRVEGEVVLQLTGLRDPSRSNATEVPAPAPGAVTAPQAAVPERAPRAPAPPVAEGSPRASDMPPTGKVVPAGLR